MTFDTYESSTEGSQPIETIKFTLGSETFLYTSSEDQQTVSSLVYEPIPIIRGSISQTPEDRDNIVDFTVDGNNPFARKYISVVPGNRASVTVQRLQRSDVGIEVVTLFEGFISSVKFEQDGLVAKIAAQSIAAATSRSIPRYTYQGLCNHVLYDSLCQVDDTDAAFRYTGTVLTVTDSSITVAVAGTKTDGFFDGGYVEGLGGQDARLIISHTGTTLQLLLPFPFDAVGTSVTILAGCDHTIATCDTKFFTTEDATSNVINYGGFAFVPTRPIFTVGI